MKIISSTDLMSRGLDTHDVSKSTIPILPLSQGLSYYSLKYLSLGIFFTLLYISKWSIIAICYSLKSVPLSIFFWNFVVYIIPQKKTPLGIFFTIISRLLMWSTTTFHWTRLTTYIELAELEGLEVARYFSFFLIVALLNICSSEWSGHKLCRQPRWGEGGSESGDCREEKHWNPAGGRNYFQPGLILANFQVNSNIIRIIRFRRERWERTQGLGQ